MSIRVLLLAETFGRDMGYLQNLLPKYFARLGLEVHLLALDLPPYYQMGDSQRVFGNFFTNSRLLPGTIESIDGYTLHVLPHRRRFGYVRMIGFYRKIRELQPDVVMTSVSVGWIALDAAIGRILQQYQLFTGNHTGLSVLPSELMQPKYPWTRKMRFILPRALPGRAISLFSNRCYAVTRDCAWVAQRIMGVQKKKIEIQHLGVDTDVFFPRTTAEHENQRAKLRESLDVQPDEILSIHSGKMSQAKNALIIALATKRLREMGLRFRAIFIGVGDQVSDISAIEGCQVVGFMKYSELGAYYRAADIGIWPTTESTSTLDAAACGVPLIVSDGIGYFDHVVGNGLVYKKNNLDDLVEKMKALESRVMRYQLGSAGATKMAERFSWNRVAALRYQHIIEALA